MIAAKIAAGVLLALLAPAIGAVLEVLTRHWPHPPP